MYRIGQVVRVNHPEYTDIIQVKITGLDGPHGTDIVDTINFVIIAGSCKGDTSWAEINWIQ